jgi:hypothetical protein
VPYRVRLRLNVAALVLAAGFSPPDHPETR